MASVIDALGEANILAEGIEILKNLCSDLVNNTARLYKFRYNCHFSENSYFFPLPKFLNNCISTSGYFDRYSFWVQEILGSFSKSQSIISNSPSVP